MARLQLLLLTALVAACSSAPQTSDFFPPSILGPGRTVYWGPYLVALGQTPLPPKAHDHNAHVYRFTWLRTFDHPICIVLKVQRSGKSALGYFESSGKGGYDPGSITVAENRRLSVRETRQFLELLDRASFWSQRAIDRVQPLDSDDSKVITIQLDGAIWIIEGVRDGRYQMVDQWSPESGAFRDAALFLVSLSRRRVENVY
jgi:hypothetical protein